MTESEQLEALRRAERLGAMNHALRTIRQHTGDLLDYATFDDPEIDVFVQRLAEIRRACDGLVE